MDGHDGPQPILTMTGISKAFPGVKALDDVDFRLFPGEVHALMGENGAGKSHPDQGADRRLRASTRARSSSTGRRCAFASPLQAQQAGVSTVYQEVNLCPNLSVAENIFIGREPRRLGRIQWSAVRRRARRAARPRCSLDIDVSALLGAYSLAVQQMVAIARAIDISAKVLILDEPTSSLDQSEVAQLFRVMRQLKDAGHRDRLRHPLPRPGLRDLRPDHRAAQRAAGRRVADRGAAASSSSSRR